MDKGGLHLIGICPSKTDYDDSQNYKAVQRMWFNQYMYTTDNTDTYVYVVVFKSLAKSKDLHIFIFF